jgi:hypothetical protein
MLIGSWHEAALVAIIGCVLGFVAHVYRQYLTHEYVFRYLTPDIEIHLRKGHQRHRDHRRHRKLPASDPGILLNSDAIA